MRKPGNAGKSIRIQEEYQEIEAGQKIKLGEDLKHRYWKKTWIDEVNDKLWKRKMRLNYPVNYREYKTNNKTLMEYAIEYVEKTNVNQEILWQINYVGLKKGVLLPCELVSTTGKMQTECYRDINELSLIW